MWFTSELTNITFKSFKLLVKYVLKNRQRKNEMVELLTIQYSRDE